MDDPSEPVRSLFIFVDSGPDAGGFRRNINVFSEPLPGDDANFDAALADVRRLIASIHLPSAG